MRAVDIHDLEQEWAETTSGSIRGLCRTGKSPVLGGWRSIPVLVVTTADGAAYEFRGKVADWHAHLASVLAARGHDVRVTAGGITIRPAQPGLEG